MKEGFPEQHGTISLLQRDPRWAPNHADKRRVGDYRSVRSHQLLLLLRGT